MQGNKHARQRGATASVTMELKIECQEAENTKMQDANWGDCLERASIVIRCMHIVFMVVLILNLFKCV